MFRLAAQLFIWVQTLIYKPFVEGNREWVAVCGNPGLFQKSPDGALQLHDARLCCQALDFSSACKATMAASLAATASCQQVNGE